MQLCRRLHSVTAWDCAAWRQQAAKLDWFAPMRHQNRTSASENQRKPRVIDIALQAGVSTATVDRVLNERPGVRAKTIKKVLDAMDRLGASTARPKVIPSVPAGLTIDVVLAQGAGFANDVLSADLKTYCEQVGFSYRRTFSKRMVPEACVEPLTIAWRSGRTA